MGLDQYAFTPDNSENPDFIWRKHAKLQTFMENIYYNRAGSDAETFNCVDLNLTAEDIETLEELEHQEAVKLQERKHKGIETEKRSQPSFRERAGPIIGRACQKL